jgi:hypothetical protein
LLQREGQYLHGGFWLGSKDFIRWLRELPPERERRIAMTRISHVNELYGGNEALERLQRRHPRFFNTCMMMSLLGAATSDGLESGQVVSGVGGQYNFVAMAHALHDSRSVLMLRATREAKGKRESNLVWSHGHVTIPRHLRDIVITEYGIADLRDASDEDCIRALIGVADPQFAPSLSAEARGHGKLGSVDAPRGASADALSGTLASFRSEGLLPSYPLGSDFTAIEQRLVQALGWLRARSATRGGMLRTVLAAVATTPAAAEREALHRLALEHPRGGSQHLLSRLVALALRRVAGAQPATG